MLCRLVVLSTLLLGAIGLALAGPAAAQDDPSLEAVVATFAGTTIDDWTDAGFVLEPVCVSAPPEIPVEGAMGFHAVHPARIDFDVVPGEPDVLLVDADGNVIGFEWEVPDQSQDAPVLFGQSFDDTPPHPGIEAPHWSLHVWTIDNPAGQFAAFNPAVTCPVVAEVEGATELAQTGSDMQLIIALAAIASILVGTVITGRARRVAASA